MYDRPMEKKRVKKHWQGMLAEQHRPSEELDSQGEILVECHSINRSNPLAGRGGLPRYLATKSLHWGLCIFNVYFFPLSTPTGHVETDTGR